MYISLIIKQPTTMLHLTHNTYIPSRYIVLDISRLKYLYISTSENFDYGWEYLQTSYKLENKRTTKTLNNVEWWMANQGDKHNCLTITIADMKAIFYIRSFFCSFCDSRNYLMECWVFFGNKENSICQFFLKLFLCTYMLPF